MWRKVRVRFLAAAVTILVLVIIIAAALFLQDQPLSTVQIRLSSEPFPLAVGPTTLLISLTNDDGAPVDNASIEVVGHMSHAGMLPLAGRTSASSNGQYRVSIPWTMMGSWTVDVTAELPGRSEVVQERFEVFAYPVPPANAGGQTTYRSVTEMNTLLASKSSDEFWIVIPQGTEAMMRMGQGDDVIPEEIRLKLDGQNVLVVRNDDIADHNVGPFFVRAGETIRQEFSSPAVLQGACSINHGAEVYIVVES
jgi:hypothetical protein